MGDAALCDLAVHVVGLLDAPQAVPDALAAADHEGRDGEVHAVDQAGAQELPHDVDPTVADLPGVTLVGLAALAGSSAWLFALSVAVWTVGEILHTPVMMGLVSELAPTHGRGRYQGVYSLSWSLASLLGPAGGGLLLQYAGPAVLWSVCGAIGTAAALGYAVLARRTGATGRRPGAVIEVAPAEETEKAPAGA